MTRLEERLIVEVLASIGDLPPRQAAERLFRLGLVDRRACEALALRSEVRRLYALGIRRCEAIREAARTFCCSYEKARSIYYDKS